MAACRLGSVRQVVKANGMTANWYNYDALGLPTAQSRTLENSYQFASAPLDTVYRSSTDGYARFYNLNARLYNPAVGRFLTQDTYRGSPWAPWTQNLYVYTGNNPVNWTDPTGHCVKDEDNNCDFVAQKALQQSAKQAPDVTKAKSPEEFVEMLTPYAQEAQRKTGIPWQVYIAQAALETGWGKNVSHDDDTARNSFNLFNIKGQGPAGSVKVTTTEYENGVAMTIVDDFRAYHDYSESFADYGLLMQDPNYAQAMEVRDDPRKFARALQAAGYATDPEYADKLIWIMDNFMGGP